MQIQLPKLAKHRGNIEIMFSAFVGVIAVALLVMIYLYVGSTLDTSLNDPNVTTVWDNVKAGVINFTAQFGTVGTVAGVALLLGVIGTIGYLGYMGYQKTRGGGSGM